jgi:hypothetical protein
LVFDFEAPWTNLFSRSLCLSVPFATYVRKKWRRNVYGHWMSQRPIKVPSFLDVETCTKVKRDSQKDRKKE